MGKHFLNNLFTYLLLAFGLLLSINSSAFAAQDKQFNLSPIFVQLSDVMNAVKNDRTLQAQQLLAEMEQQFLAIPQHTSHAGLAVSQAFSEVKAKINNDNLTALSAALLAFDKEQHPLDIKAQKRLFEKRIVPAFKPLQRAVQESIKTRNVVELIEQYRIFNLLWNKNERTVRDVDLNYYGQIETALALLRVAMESSPPDFAKIQQQTETIERLFNHYLAGKTLDSTPTHYTLANGIELLEQGLHAFKQGQGAQAQQKLTTFIEIWPVIEGDVSTRNPNLYTQVESQLPVILAKGNDPTQQQKLQNLIGELNQINPHAAYTAFDAMLILLREGLEALLVVMALISALRVANRPQGYKWVNTGVATGLATSIVMAFVLQHFFPAVSSGSNREMIEGFVGILAVLMILSIGAWLHSKSSIKAWQAYIKKHMGKALTTGSFVSLFGLSFLAVFREGAETILFYVGILPNISIRNFSLGIGLAVLILAMLSLLIIKTSVKLPVPTMFKILTWVLYLLGFKILGVSVHALQITGYLPTTILGALPSIELIGLYSTLETLAAQAMYLFVIWALHRYWMNREQTLH